MLQSIREHLHGWIAGIILTLMVASFLLFGVQYYLQSSSAGSAAAATVNGEKITAQQWDNAYQRLRDNLQAHSKLALTLSMQAHLRKVALQQLITQAAINTTLQKQDWTATPLQVQAMLNTIPAFQVNGQFSEDRYEQVLSLNGLTPTEFEKQMRSDVLNEQIQSGLSQSSFVLPNEVTAGYNLLRQTRDFGYMIVPSSIFLKSVQVSAQEIQDYYAKNMKLWATPEQVSVTYLAIDPKAIAATVKISDAAVQQYYQDHVDHFRGPPRWQVKALFAPTKEEAEVQNWVKQLEAGKPIDQVGAATTRWMDAGKNTDPKMVSVLSQMQPQQISVPVTVKDGTYIFELLASTPGTSLPLSQVKNEIQQALQNEKVQKILMKQSDRLEKITYTHPDSLAPAAKALNLPLETTEMFTRKGAKTGLFSNPMLIQTAFDESVLQGNNSTVLTLSDGMMVVMHVLQHQPKQVEPLSAVQDKIHALLMQHAAKKKAAKFANHLKLLMAHQTDPATLAKQNGLSWMQEKNQARNAMGVNPAILTAVFHTAMDTDRSRVADIMLTNGDYAVVRLDAVHLPAASGLTSVMQQALSGQLKDLNAQAEYQLYVRSMKHGASIKHKAAV